MLEQCYNVKKEVNTEEVGGPITADGRFGRFWQREEVSGLTEDKFSTLHKCGKIDCIMLLMNPIVYRPTGQGAVQRGKLSIVPPSPVVLRSLCKQENSRPCSKLTDQRFRDLWDVTELNTVEVSESQQENAGGIISSTMSAPPMDQAQFQQVFL